MTHERQRISPQDPIDIITPEFLADPFPTLAALRDTAPVQRVLRPNGQTFWLVTRYEDALFVLRDRRFSNDSTRLIDPIVWNQLPAVLRRPAMFLADPPDHTRLRGLVSKAFTSQRVERLRPHIQALADALIDRVEPRGVMDLIDDFAFPLPITVILELLGVPTADRDLFRSWSKASLMGLDKLRAARSPELLMHLQVFADYLDALFAQKRAHPQDDLISELVRVEETGDRLSGPELQGIVVGLIVGGHETTMGLISLGMLQLLTHPEQLALLKADPALIPGAVEELLRYCAVTSFATPRYATEDLVIGGVQIARGEQVVVSLAAVNRDATRFRNGDRLDVTRSDQRHLALGHGLHYCLGASLARVEAQIAFATLLRRLPNMRLGIAPDQVVISPSAQLRGLVRLPIVF